jgi:acyl-CoA thioesterase FadM
MVTAKQTLVLVDLSERKACPIPDPVVERLRDFEGADLDIGVRASA